MLSPLDAQIPFLEIFIIPYYIWYFYIACALVYLFFKSPENFVKLCWFMYGGMAIACFIYTMFPNGQHLRPHVYGNDILSRMVRYTYSVDTPANSAPSIHVMNSIAVHCALINCRKIKSGFFSVKTASFILMVLICASTVLVKQHSIIDVAGGVAISSLLYLIIYRLDILTGIPRKLSEI
jgi:membrane-associated phospholipid phosphatase